MAVLYKNLCLHTPRTYTKLPLVFNIIFKRKISENLYMNCCFIVVCIFTTDSCKKLYECSLYACNNKSVLHENYNTRSTQRPNTHKFVCSFNVKCHLQSSCNFFLCTSQVYMKFIKYMNECERVRYNSFESDFRFHFDVYLCLCSYEFATGVFMKWFGWKKLEAYW